MPNQANFRSNITNITDPRFTASRIVKVPSELILYEETPASFAFDKDDNIEVHFYSVTTNELILSTVINLQDAIVKSHIVAYKDNSYKNYIRIDFTKLFLDKDLILIPGDYRMVLNFFSNEIGSYYNKKLTINRISDTRTEVELVFNDTIDEVSRQENLELVREFVEKSFNKTDAVGAAEKIFKSGVESNDSTEGLTAINIENNIEMPEIGQTYENTLARIDRIGLREIFDTQLNDFLLELFKYVREEIVINGDERIQEDEYQEIIRKVVLEKITNLRQTVDSRIVVS
jgi:hypothetical protein